jgi:hypothetical protein
VQPLSQKGAISVLAENIKDNKAKAQELITNIGANKAWKYTVDKLQDRSLKTELNLWAQAVSKISKTESKRTQKWRKFAKQKMQKCKDVIPCWIMSLQQLADLIVVEFP